MLNIGCGAHFHEAWRNIDFAGSPPVVRHDLRMPLPFDDSTFDCCYHSHVLEHLSLAEGVNLLREYFRVLGPNGILRVVVPDLENMAREYLKAIAGCENEQQPGSAGKAREWMVLELFDQTLRSRPGGEMAVYLKKYRDNEMVCRRMGAGTTISSAIGAPSPRRLPRLSRKTLCRAAVRLIGGKQLLHAIDDGLFRNFGGEVHKAVYDRISLREMLEKSGFVGVRVVDAKTSAIPHFFSYHLDADDAGRIRKPGSLFMEAVKA